MMIPAFIMIGSISIPAILPGYSSSSRATPSRAVKPTTRVMAVIAPRHLDDQVAVGDRAHQVDGVHGRLGARVGEPPQRQAEPAGQLLGNEDRRRRRLGEVRAERGLAAYRLHDRGMTVPGHGRAVSAVQVDVLVSVDVVDLGSLAVAEPDRLRPGDLPAGGDAPGEHAVRARGHPARFALALDEDLLLLSDELVEAGRGSRAGVGGVGGLCAV